MASSRALPVLPLVGAGCLIAVAIVAAVTAHVAPPPTAAVVVARDLAFVDGADGSVAVRDPRDGAVIAVLAPGTNGFIRSTVRGLARERRRQDLGAATPFRLIAWDDSRLTLEDPSTGRSVDLKAFGPTNADAFAQLMIGPGPAR